MASTRSQFLNTIPHKRNQDSWRNGWFRDLYVNNQGELETFCERVGGYGGQEARKCSVNDVMKWA